VSEHVSVLKSPLLRSFCHGFSTRDGGVSVGALSSLNLALREQETREALQENWRRVLNQVGFGGGLGQVALLEQVHEGGVAHIETGGGVLKTVAVADGAVTASENVLLVVRTADCVPVLFGAPGGVGVAHAGWRGVAASVASKTLERLCALTGDAPSEVVAVVGPHISTQAYEVGEEVVDGIVASGVPRERFVVEGPKAHVSLYEAVCYQLESAGVGQVASLDCCTFRDERFFSHRRDGGQTGRLASVIARSSGWGR
jgi:polyphenol oxidase